MINLRRALAFSMGLALLKVASIATTACFLIIIEEPDYPESLKER